MPRRLIDHSSLIMLVLGFVLVFSGAVVGAQEQTYTVQPGETLQAIAEEFGVPVDAILIRNNIIDPNRIRSGQTLIIPSGMPPIPSTHTIQPGERLSDIALRYGVTLEELTAANDIADPNRVRAGTVLTIPSATTTPLPPATGGPVPLPETQPVPLPGTPTIPNATTPVQPGGFPQQEFPLPGSGFVQYIVDRGETLQTIAAAYGTSWQTLAAINNIPNPNYLEAGSRILIPSNNLGVGGGAPTLPPDVIFPVPPTPVPPLPVMANRIYIVQPRDMLSTIAPRFGVTVESIRALNGIVDNRLIFPGQPLLIPPATGYIPAYPVLPRQVIGGQYVVQYGDTLLAIARDFGVDVFNLARANQIFNLNHIYAGQPLTIPGYF